MVVDMGWYDCGYQNQQYHMGICFSKKVYIHTYDYEQSNRTPSILITFDNILRGIDIHCHSCMLYRNIFRNSRSLLRKKNWRSIRMCTDRLLGLKRIHLTFQSCIMLMWAMHIPLVFFHWVCGTKLIVITRHLLCLKVQQHNKY